MIDDAAYLARDRVHILAETTATAISVMATAVAETAQNPATQDDGWDEW